MHETPYVSVLIPAKNEAGNLIPLLEEVRTALANENFEVIVVDDGSTDATAAELRTLQGEWLPAIAGAQPHPFPRPEHLDLPRR